VTATLRRQVDYRVLRWQYRLDSPSVDRLLPWGLAGVLFAVLAFVALANERQLGNGAVLANHIQGTWLIRTGRDTALTIGGVDYLGDQAALILWPLAQVSRVVPTVELLLLTQAFALAAGVVPIWRLARRVVALRVGPAVALVAAYALHPAVHTLAVRDFNPESYAVPALLGAVLYGIEGRHWRLGLVVAVVLATRADLGLAVAGLGVLLAVEGRRRSGFALAIAGVAWAALAVFAFQPALSGGSYPHLGAFSAYGGSPFEILRGMVTDPVEVLGDLFAQDNVVRIVLLLAPFVFLPLAAVRYLAPALPLTALYLLADQDLTLSGAAGSPQQDVPLLVFSVVASVFAVRRLGRRTGIGRVVVDRSLVGVMVAGALLVSAIDSPLSPYEEPWDWGRRDAADAARLTAAELVSPEGVLRASGPLLPPVAEREGLQELDTSGPAPTPRDAVTGADALLFDEAAAPRWTRLQLREFIGTVRAFGFEVTYREAGIWLFERTADP
jgi:uncharacterized membrane protein